MPEILIKTNGTVEGTILTVDGKEVSKKEKIIGIDFMAMAPYTSQYSGDSIAGYVSVNYDKANEDGTIERKALVSGKDNSSTGIGQKIKSTDQVIRYIDQEADAEITDLITRIIDHAKEANIKIPPKENLLNRSIQSLKDKCEDYGIKLDDTNGHTHNLS